MSELKAYDHEFRPNEYGKFYLKSEADKVIADLEESHKKEVEQLLMKIVELKDHNENYRFDNKNMLHKITKQDAELRHQKYKRCLTMAKWCKAEQDAAFLRYNWDTGRYADVDFYEKWHKRWLELAEKFKEAK